MVQDRLHKSTGKFKVFTLSTWREREKKDLGSASSR